MKKLLLTFLSIAAVCCSLYAQREVTQERMEQIIFAETTAIGIRHAIMQRSILHRETDQKKSSFGKVAVKRLQKEQDTKPGLQKVIICLIGVP